jgi:hypothetical protein
VSEAVRARSRASAAAAPSRAATRTSTRRPAPYFTILAPARVGSQLEQWDEIKAAASDAVLAAGGTITHHHAVGRDHRPWYDRQRPDAFAAALRAAKRALDPGGDHEPGRVDRSVADERRAVLRSRGRRTMAPRAVARRPQEPRTSQREQERYSACRARPLASTVSSDVS